MLEHDERLIQFHQREDPLTPETLEAMRHAGIRTSVLGNWASWHELEPSPGVY